MHASIYDNDTLTALRDQVARFIQREVLPNGDAWERDGRVPHDVLRKLGATGLLGIRYEERFGGSELDTIATATFAEELARSTFAGFNITVLVHTDMASPHIARAGSEEQLARYMPGIVSGEFITAIGVTEPGAGSDVAAMRTRAARTNDGWVLNGSKMFITNGASADLVVVAARTDPKTRGSRGISMFLVHRDTPGFSVARALDKTGWRCSDTAELVFSDCEIPANALLGEEHMGFYAIMQNFQNERIVLGAMAVGEAQKALELTLDHVRQREAFGSALWAKQTIRHRLAMLQAEVAAARSLVYHAAWLDSRGIDATKEVSMVKALCGELVNRVLYACQQFHGGYGYIREHPIERMARDARIASIGGGATEVMLEEVAKRM